MTTYISAPTLIFPIWYSAWRATAVIRAWIPLAATLLNANMTLPRCSCPPIRARNSSTYFAIAVVYDAVSLRRWSDYQWLSAGASRQPESLIWFSFRSSLFLS
ncbi:uncharacterized protein BJ212DRAFT_1353237 [Suillus subaureus]|uniref:Uncharacterized protein n=1 Tax=Suillus subaureus TaxID=48587 RepID=A0A9P7JE02_9AGAM|nr:uncharacterized protein BJ212DRAFT_1353237 [Suillus subaureus]KAG1816784.1 hypothetical protein BJ212DRAFT_1353237 [Suillus subaureus]